jgi:hypothetical protein
MRRSTMVLHVSVLLCVGSIMWTAWSVHKWRERSSLQIHPSAVALGDVFAGDEVIVPIKITNNGKKEVLIENVKPSCECTVGRLSSPVVKVGESSNLTIVWSLGKDLGPSTQSVLIRFTEPSQAPLHASISANVIAPIHSIPAMLDNGAFADHSGNIIARVSIVALKPNYEFRIMDVQSDNPYFRPVRLLKHDNENQCDIDVYVGAVATARSLRGMLTITTDKPGFRTLTVPISYN